MSQTRKLFVNVLASHASSMYGLVVGLLTGRWALLSLGHESFGLLSLVGGLIAFVSLFNMVFSNAVVRFFAVAIGEAHFHDDALAIENCQRWFNVVLFIHVIVPVALLIVGYPLGVLMVRRFLEIPPTRIEECVWVFRFTCLTCLVGMVNVPFRAMYVAKQFIAELTIYGVVQTTAHLVVLWYFISHPGNWFVPMAAWHFILQFLPSLVQAVRALFSFKECRFVLRYMLDFSKLRDLSMFAGWQFMGALGMMLRNQGTSILINKFQGAAFNATAGIATTISGHAQVFANGINSAFAPAISTAFGAKDNQLMCSLVWRCDKFSTLLVLILVLPLSLEMEYVVTLWLKNPPPSIVPLAICLCCVTLLNKLTSGHEVAINASGKIVGMQMCLFLWYLSVAILAWMAFANGGGVVWAGIASMIAMGGISATRIVIAAKNLNFSWRGWCSHVCIPLTVVALFSFCVGRSVRVLLPVGLFRVAVVSLATTVALGLLSWIWLLSETERSFVMTRLKGRLVFRHHE